MHAIGGPSTLRAVAGDAALPERTDPDGRMHLRVTLPATVRPAVHRSSADPAESVPLLATTVANGWRWRPCSGCTCKHSCACSR